VRLRRDKGKAGDILADVTKDLPAIDAALTYALTMTVVQNLRYIDKVLSSIRPGKLEPLIRDILRLGAAQILFLRIPAHAAVNETVALARHAVPRLSGLCNGVLRRLAQHTSQEWEELLNMDLTLKYSLPDWLYAEAVLALNPSEVEPWAKTIRQIPPVSALCHPERELSETFEVHPLYRDMVLIRTPISRIPDFQTGKLLVIDAGARILVDAMGLLPGWRVWDCCASPGGKSVLCAFAVGKEGYVLASDISEPKVAKITQRARAMGLPWIGTQRLDARNGLKEQFDAVLCDVPCSGLGVISKKPDICLKDPMEFTHLPELQNSILTGCAKSTTVGGTLL
jgi:16S rRNA (cytosine967-C5)-methyltransferase